MSAQITRACQFECKCAVEASCIRLISFGAGRPLPDRGLAAVFRIPG